LSRPRLRIRPHRLHARGARPRGRTLMVDKDFVAVDLRGAQRALNGLANADAQLSNGFEQIDPARASTSSRATSPPRSARSCCRFCCTTPGSSAARRAALPGHRQRPAGVHEAQPAGGLRQLRQAQAGGALHRGHGRNLPLSDQRRRLNPAPETVRGGPAARAPGRCDIGTGVRASPTQGPCTHSPLSGRKRAPCMPHCTSSPSGSRYRPATRPGYPGVRAAVEVGAHHIVPPHEEAVDVIDLEGARARVRELLQGADDLTARHAPVPPCPVPDSIRSRPDAAALATSPFRPSRPHLWPARRLARASRSASPAGVVAASNPTSSR
jgi:hypothetical protein